MSKTPRTLVVMAKQPQAGRTKTRLSPPLTGEQAAELYYGFLLDTLDLMGQIASLRRVVAYAPPEAQPFFRSIVPEGFECLPQEGHDLSQRLARVTSDLLGSGCERVVVIGSDSPTLPSERIQQAFERLSEPTLDLVLGPCDDGGYYLLGLRAPSPRLFSFPMSTATVTRQTLAAAEESGLRVALLPEWYDVDEIGGLRRLRGDLATSPACRAVHTRRFLERLDTM